MTFENNEDSADSIVKTVGNEIVLCCEFCDKLVTLILYLRWKQAALRTVEANLLHNSFSMEIKGINKENNIVLLYDNNIWSVDY